MSRKTLYTPEMVEKICDMIIAGDSLRKIGGTEGMPELDTMCKWFHKHPEFYEKYIKAKEVRAELAFDELIEMADDEDVKTFEQVNRQNMRINTRKWCLARMNFSRFGDKQEKKHSGEINITKVEQVIVDTANSGS